MPSTYTNNLGIELPADGELDGVWGDVVNDNMNILDRAINGSLNLSLSGTSSTLTTSNGILSNGQYKALILGGSPSGTHTITISPNDAQKIYYVYNLSGQSVIIAQGSGTTVTIANGDTAIIYSDGGGPGAGVVNLTDHFAMNSVKITGGTITGITDLSIADGGTGASTAADARTNLGLGTMATQTASSVAITGGSITGITDLALADGGTGASTAAQALVNFGLSATAAELNYSSGVTSAIQTQLNNKPSLTGSGASGTWGINISGNAATATNAANATNASYAANAGNASTVTTITSTQVGNATAGLAAGAVGSYLWASCSGLINVGDTRAGSNLSPAGFFASFDWPQGAPASSGSGVNGADTGGAPYGGTWRCMGSSLNYTAYPARARMTLFLRIS